MSDQDQQDAMEAFEQDEEGTDVEAHSLDQESLDQIEATEEPPDVEGHSLDAPASLDQLD